MEFKYRNGQRLFFQGKNASVPYCDPRISGISLDRIYEGKVIGCEISVDDMTPDDVIPTQRTTEQYTLQVGTQKLNVIVPAEHLRENVSELTPLTITYLYNSL